MRTRVTSPSYTRVYVPKAMSVPIDRSFAALPPGPGRVVSIDGMGRVVGAPSTFRPQVSASPSSHSTVAGPAHAPSGHAGGGHGHRPHHGGGHGGSPPAGMAESAETSSAPPYGPVYVDQAPFNAPQGAPLTLSSIPWQVYLGGALLLGCVGYTAWALFFRSSSP
jgi:hypothetical protein